MEVRKIENKGLFGQIFSRLGFTENQTVKELLRSALSSGGGKSDMNKLLTKILEQQMFRSRQDLATWKLARMEMENLAMPRRIRLMRLYDDVELDSHLTAIMRNRQVAVLKTPFSIVNRQTKKEVPELSLLLQRSWFFKFLELAHGSIYRGHTLIELGDINEEKEIDCVEEIPRINVLPITGEVLPNITANTTIPYRNTPLMNTLVEVGNPREPGLLFKAAIQALYKKNVQAAWASYCDIFGMPVRVGKIASRNTDDIAKMEEFLQNMGTAAYAVINEGDTIEFAETGKGDAYQVYMQFITLANAEMSKVIYGQTMTSDNGSSRSQSEVHERMADHYSDADRAFLYFVINGDLIPKLINMGYPLKDCEFVWDVKKDLTELDVKADEMLLTNFEFDDFNYFQERYGVPIKGRREAAAPILPPKTKQAFKAALKANKEIERLYNLKACNHELPHD